MFSIIACNETDLEALTTQVLAIVQGTMQPASLSLWLTQTSGEQQSANPTSIEERAS